MNLMKIKQTNYVVMKKTITLQWRQKVHVQGSFIAPGLGQQDPD